MISGPAAALEADWRRFAEGSHIRSGEGCEQGETYSHDLFSSHWVTILIMLPSFQLVKLMDLECIFLDPNFEFLYFG